jgi:glycosyltransferase involved in cell wall biosynthesis
MRIGVAGPVTLPMLSRHVSNGGEMPPGYKFAPMAAWVEALLSRGHEVVLFTLAPEVNEPRKFAGEQLTIHIGRYRPRHRARDLFARERQDLLEAMRADRCDILHANWTYEFALAALDTGFPTLVTIHDPPLSVLRYNVTPYRFIRTLMAWHVARRAQFMTAVTDDTKDHFRRVFCYKGHLTVIPNAVAQEIFDLGRPVREHKCDHVTFATILCGWGGRKNGQTALLAFHRLKQIIPSAQLVMFGEGHGQGEAAEAWAREQGLADGVNFAGMVTYATLMHRLSTEIDVVLHPAFVEAHSMAVAEALALGLPVIAGRDTGGMRYLLEHGKTGMLVDVSSEKCVFEAMFKLARHPGLRVGLGRAAHESARRRLSVNVVMSAYEKEYERVIMNWPSAWSHATTAHMGEK